MEEERKDQTRDMIFALDIGTRSIIGVVGRPEGDRIRVLALEKLEHSKRAMIDGQIEDIEQVGRVAKEVTARLEQRLGCNLTRVCIAAAGRALHTETGHFELQLPEVRRVTDELIAQLEAGAVSAAERALGRTDEREGRFYLVGYTVSKYLLDNYPISTLRGHNGQKLETDVVATFLPAEVVESLYSAMRAAGLEVVSLTLEPIAAINAAIPPELRLLNLVMADIGAGTSDIAACRDGSVVGYTMATVAGDEITESIMKAYLVDFSTAERLKAELPEAETLSFTDILGLSQTLPAQEVSATIQPALKSLAEELGRRIRELNNGAPSAVFLAGGGSKLGGLREAVAEALDMDERRVAIAGSNFKVSVFSDEESLEDPEYATPLGIAVSAGLGLIPDSYRVTLNGQPAKLFRSGVLTALDVLQMNGFNYADLIGRTGQSLSVTVDGRRTLYRGEPAAPCLLLINGAEQPPSTVVQTGDVIDFTPARSGKPGSRTLEQALGSAKAAAAALVNGIPASPDYLLRSGDMVETNAIIPLIAPVLPADAAGLLIPPADETETGPEAAAADTEAASAAPAAAEPDRPAEPDLASPSMADGNRLIAAGETTPLPVIPTAAAMEWETASMTETSRPTGAEVPLSTGAEVPLPTGAEVPLSTGAETGAPSLTGGSDAGRGQMEMADRVAAFYDNPPPPPPKPEPVPAAPLPPRSFFLNGEPLELPAKKDGAPYYLMDLLDHSGLDFERLDRPVSLMVNGQESSFMQVLMDGDAVSIKLG